MIPTFLLFFIISVLLRVVVIDKFKCIHLVRGVRKSLPSRTISALRDPKEITIVEDNHRHFFPTKKNFPAGCFGG